MTRKTWCNKIARAAPRSALVSALVLSTRRCLAPGLTAVRLPILVASLVAAAAGCSGGADIGKGYDSKSGDLGAFILNSAPKFGVRLLRTNGLPPIPAKWRCRERSNEFNLVVEGNYFPQLHSFLTKAIGPAGAPMTNSPTKPRSIQAYYGTNQGATVGCSWEMDKDGKQFTGFVIVSYLMPTPAQLKSFTQSLQAALANENDSDKALDEARSSAPYVTDFIRLFPEAEVRHRNFDASLGFDVTADLYERYELTMQLPAVFDSSYSKVIGYGAPRFYLRETASVRQ